MKPVAEVVVRGRVLTAEGLRSAEILVAGGRILDVVPIGADARSGRGKLYDAGEALVLPGFVDTHVHVNEPGRTEWEGFATATDAAAAGGVTTIVDMPLNSSPVTCTVDALAAKRDAARGKLRVDVGFWGGVIPGNAAELAPLARGGVFGFKCFLVDSGLDEFPPVAEADLRPAMRELARLGVPLLAHAELPGPIAAVRRRLPDRSRRHADWVASRPPEAELEAVRLLIRLARETGCAVHVVHVSAAACVPEIEAARREGIRITAETCPHYLTCADAEISDGATEFKCAPPIRDAANRERLWRALESGALDLIASDHSPCPPAWKAGGKGDFFQAWGGIASLQLAPSVAWTGARARDDDVETWHGWVSSAPAALAGLDRRKGRIAPGHDADLVIFDPEAEFVVTAAGLHDRNRRTPYEGRTLTGVVRRTYVRGRLVFADGELRGERRGEILERSAGEER